MVAWWGNSRLMIFWLFYKLFSVKWPVEFDCPINYDYQAKLTDSSQCFYLKKVGMIENYKYGGMVRESPPYDFLIILHATLCKMTRTIWFSN